MSTLPKYIIARSRSTELPPVVRTEPPYLIARAMSIPLDQEFISTAPHAKIKNYSIYLLPNGCFVGGCESELLQDILDEMAQEYYDIVVHPNARKFKNCCENWDEEKALNAEARQERLEVEKQRKFAKAARELFNE